MNDPLHREALAYGLTGRERSHAWLIVLAALACSLATVFLLPLSELVAPQPRQGLDIRTVDTADWTVPPPTLPPPPPPRQPPDPPPPEPELRLAQPAPVPAPAERLKLPVKLDFNLASFAGDFTLDFEVAALPVPIPEAAVQASAPVESPAAAAPRPEVVESAPTATFQARPIYPLMARQREIEGYVDLQFTVTRAGRVEELAVVAAEPAGVFEDAAAAAVRRWRFEPARRNDERVPARLQVRIRFNLER